ncbi:phosphatidylinositol-glycan biosynthesis class W protein [Erythrolamprus reginae]|uniref:phosphatidylinositol-glycan biosynthesis class W protein n=1 Tax=Erythrolamprus reginae TaxID=121349 RepID=UPI00396CB7DD
MSQQLVKEAFLSNLNGTTLLEVSVGISLAPLCVLTRGLLLILYFLHNGRPLCSMYGNFFLDFTVLIIPSILTCTILADILHFVILSIIAFCTGLIFVIYTKRTNYARASLKQILDDFLRTNLDPGNIPSITFLRVFVNLLTSINILAVDFPQYPRRYAKTESYGTGVMDLGVGIFVFGNGLVCPEVRLKPGATQNKFFYLTRQLLTIWPLLLLGFGRLMSVKAADYYEHVTEYGVHWNFFFTLAAIRIGASLLLTVFPVHKAWIVAIMLAVVYECFLEITPLKRFILHGSNGQDSRTGFLNANREGIFSVVGYLAIYMASVQVGLHLLGKRTTPRVWLKTVCYFLQAILMLFICLCIAQRYIDTVSRRMANLSFCIWIVANCFIALSSFLVVDLILVFTKLVVGGADIPSSWNILHPSTYKKSEFRHRKNESQNMCMISAVNKNQLLFFLLANVLTGFVNMHFDTMHSNTLSAMLVVHLYMFTNCLIMYMLQAKNIILKCW